jgi:eukaryotic-like serine/threonine-protein kinase
VVYRARRRGTDQAVALKLFRPGPAVHAERFRAEAEALRRLDHPGVVPLLDAGEHEGRFFLTMPLVEGESLAEAGRKKSGKWG